MELSLPLATMTASSFTKGVHFSTYKPRSNPPRAEEIMKSKANMKPTLNYTTKKRTSIMTNFYIKKHDKEPMVIENKMFQIVLWSLYI